MLFRMFRIIDDRIEKLEYGKNFENLFTEIKKIYIKNLSKIRNSQKVQESLATVLKNSGIEANEYIKEKLTQPQQIMEKSQYEVYEWFRKRMS